MNVESEGTTPDALPVIVDRDYCATSFLALRHVWRRGVAWEEHAVPIFHRRTLSQQIPVSDAEEMHDRIAQRLAGLDPDTTGVMLSGGMDSAIVASYLPAGARAFSFRFEDPSTLNQTVAAREYAEQFDLRFVEVPIKRADYFSHLPQLMRNRWSPVHSIEPQIHKALLAARDLGVRTVVTGENADSIFGGLDGLVGTERSFADFVRRYTFVNPATVLIRPVEYVDAFLPSRRGDGLDAHHFVSTVFAEESLNSYLNPASLLGVDLISPFAEMVMAMPLDVERISRGESKYLVRDLFRLRFGDLQPREKLPMPRSVGSALAGWPGPRRTEFKADAVRDLSPDQRWMVFVLEAFLEVLDGE